MRVKEKVKKKKKEKRQSDRNRILDRDRQYKSEKGGTKERHRQRQ